MLKPMLCLMIIAICGYLGILFAKKYRERIEMLNELSIILQTIKNSIYISNSKLKHAIERAQEKSKVFNSELVSFGGMFMENPKTSVNEAWDKSFCKAYPKQDIYLIKSAGEGVNILCRDFNPYPLEEKINEINGIIKTLNGNEKNKSKAYSSIGFLTGIFIAILLL